MNEDAKAESNKIWNALKPALEELSAKVTALYEAAGSPRTCRHINELWHSESAGVGLGFVPEEARGILESLIAQHGFTLYKGSGPLGKSVYFRLVQDTWLTAEKLGRFSASVEQEAHRRKDMGIKSGAKAAPVSSEEIIEQQVARMEGLSAVKKEKLNDRPPHLALIVDTFNEATATMNSSQALGLLAEAVSYLHLPEISVRELQKTLAIMRNAESL